MANFNGVPYPITRDPKGYYRKQGDLAEIQSDLLILLLTNPGERCMLPDFGTDLRSLMFEPNDIVVAQKAKQLIAQSIQKWEPRVSIQQLHVFAGPDPSQLNQQDNRTEVNHILTIQISFVDPQNIKEVQELVLQVPLGGS